MPQDYQSGTVRYFNPGKGFGFIQSDEGQKVFFRPANRGQVVISENQREFMQHFQQEVSLEACSLRERPTKKPSVTMRVTFEAIRAPKGLLAHIWVPEADYLLAVNDVQSTIYNVFAVRQQVRKGAWREEPQEPIFRGTLEELSTLYPRRRGVDGLADISTPAHRCKFVFSYEQGDTLVACLDPRARIWA